MADEKRMLRWWPVVTALVGVAFSVGVAFGTFATKAELKSELESVTQKMESKIKDEVETHEKWEREKLTPMAKDIEEMRRDLKEVLKYRR
jgi:hypothetical protein